MRWQKNIIDKIHYKKVEYFSSTHDKLISSTTRVNVDQNKPQLIIAGSGRNGSTLISAILNNHQDIFIPPENSLIPSSIKKLYLNPFADWASKVELVFDELDKPSMWNLERKKLKHELLACEPQQQSLNHILNRIYLEYSSKYKQSRDICWGDKTPSNTIYLHSIKNQFPGSKILILVRDPRAVINSLLEINLVYYETRVDYFIWRWANSLQKYDELRTKFQEDVMMIKYEDFVLEPETYVSKIVNWLGLSFDPKILDSPSNNLVLLGVNDARHHQNIRNNISAGKVDVWRQRLDHKYVTQIEKKLLPKMKSMGYV